MLKKIEERIAREIELAPGIFRQDLVSKDEKVRCQAGRDIACEVMVGVRSLPGFLGLISDRH